MTEVVKSVADIRRIVGEWKSRGERVAFVPTMGNLHAGHIALVRQARSLADRVVMSIFVNPLQFGVNEDFAKYPRTFDADLRKLEQAGTDALFFPAEQEIYPFGREAVVKVEVPGLSDILCGQYRPGHFQGVTTVVAKLLNIVAADVAFFGEKDFQQLFLIRRMVRDLHMPVEIVAGETVRESDGLAMSSRNSYLSPEERVLAPKLHAVLADIVEQVRQGAQDLAALTRAGLTELEKAGFRPQYLEIRDADTLLEPVANRTHTLVLLVAAYLGNTRLIDNLQLKLK